MDPENTELDPSSPTDQDFEDLTSVAPPEAAPADEEPADKADAPAAAAEGKAEDTDPAPAASEPAPSATPKPEDKPDLFMGKFRLTGDREKDLAILGDAYKNLESAFGTSQAAKKRLEDALIQAAAQGPAKADKPATVAEKKAAKRDLVSLLGKAALEEDDVDDDKIVEALLERLVKPLLEHPEVSTSLYNAITGVRTYETEKGNMRSSFFEANPELSDIPDWAMHRIAQEEQEKILQSPEVMAMTPQEFTQKVLENTSERARAVFGRQRKPQTPAAPAKPKKPISRQPSGTRAEGSSSHRADPAPDMSVQQEHMKDLLGR